MDTMSSGAPTIGPSVTASPPPSSWGARSHDGDSPPSSADVSPTYTAFSFGGQSPPPSRIEGWPLLAELMAKNPAFEGFARFRSLNVKNLLYYQVELAKLEEDLRKREIVDMDPDNDDDGPGGQRWSQIHKNPAIMINNNKLPRHPQWAKVKEMRQLLREYNEALLQYAQVSALGEPSSHNMRELVTWIHDQNLGKVKVKACSAEKYGPYEPRNRDITPRRFLELLPKFFKPSPKSRQVSGLVAPRAGKPPDRLGRWITEVVLPLIWDLDKYWPKKHQTKPDEERNVPGGMNEKQTEGDAAKPEDDERINEKHIQTCAEITILSITAAICTLVACMLPIAAIFLLAVVNELWHRLYMIASFSFLFASLLMLLTEATRVQVFTATSAFLAVLVVFIPAGGDSA